MSVSVRVADRITRVAPLGIRFRDPVTNLPVRDGLRVALYPDGQPWLRVFAEANPSGVYVLNAGPGLGRATRGRGDEAYWADPPEERAYRCEVSDSQARFHPVSFSLRLPFRGLFVPDCAALSPPGAERAVDLFSTPSRTMPGAMAVIRTELSVASTGKPAAWALLAVEYRGKVFGRGMADRQGRVVLAFPFPEPERRATHSPPESSSPPGPEGVLMQWDVLLRVFHSPELAADAIPDYCSVMAQPEARLLEERSPPRELPRTTVMLGRDFVYPSPDNACLFVEPV